VTGSSARAACPLCTTARPSAHARWESSATSITRVHQGGIRGPRFVTRSRFCSSTLSLGIVEGGNAREHLQRDRGGGEGRGDAHALWMR
jgi:hypothetical protein